MKIYRCCIPAPFTAVLEPIDLDTALSPQQVLVKTHYSLISPGTELAQYTHTHVGFNIPGHWAKYPLYPGYATVGEVVQVGDAVHSFHPGSIVFYRGRHQQYSVLSLDKDVVLPVPDGVALSEAPFARLAQISYTAVAMSSPSQGRTVVVLGLGIIGNMAAQLFALQGARVIGIDRVAERCRLASECGVPTVLNMTAEEAAPAVHEMTSGIGADITIEATGDPSLVSTGLQMTRKLGEVIILGSPRGTAEIDIYEMIHRRGINLKGAHESLIPVLPLDNPQGQRALSARMLDLLRTGDLKVKPLAPPLRSPAEIKQCYEDLLNRKDEAIDYLLDWTRV